MVYFESLQTCAISQLEKNKKKCSKYQFTCDNGNCISIYHRCDGDNDCGDWSDEYLGRCLGKAWPAYGKVIFKMLAITCSN